jgi:hypothetical protein
MTARRPRTTQILANFEARSVLLIAAWTLGSASTSQGPTPASLATTRHLAQRVVQMNNDPGARLTREDLRTLLARVPRTDGTT